jgi:DNA-directed RNA polymerase specialized sigma54-like protein
MQPSNLFSCHNSLDGSFVLYLEEQDANLDLLEDVVGQVPLLALSRLAAHSRYEVIDSPEATKLLDKIRGQLPDVALKIATMTEDEALALAEALIDSVKFARAIAGRPMKLELIK